MVQSLIAYAQKPPHFKNLEKSKCRDPSRQFFLWITTTSNKFENLSSWKLEIQQFVNSEGEVIKQGFLCVLSAFPLNKTKDTAEQG
jgi:hypothetical protein